MAHNHDHFHSKEEQNNYLTQQIFTIAICGALGAVAVSLFAQGTLVYVLAPLFRYFVLAGGIAVLLLVVVRAIAVWRLVGQLAPIVEHEQDHAHHHNHAHDHACCGHDHAHEHATSSPAIKAAATGVQSLNVLAPPAPSSALPLAGAAPMHDHDHEDHDHDHACCGHEHHHAPAPNGNGHDHEDDHEHGWAPWRFVLLLLPVALFVLNLPNKGFSNANADSIDMSKLAELKVSKEAKGMDWNVGFKELEEVAFHPDQRTLYEGKTIHLIGQYLKIDDKRFTLVRYKMNCCATDALPLKAVIFVDSKDAKLNPEQYRNKWVEVKGRLEFQHRLGTNLFVPVLVVAPTTEEPLSKLVEIVPQPANPFLN